MDRIAKIRKTADHGWSGFISWSGRINGMFKLRRTDLIKSFDSLFSTPNTWDNMRRKGEVRAERVVLIAESDFNYLLEVAMAAKKETEHYCRPGCNCRLCRALSIGSKEEATK